MVYRMLLVGLRAIGRGSGTRSGLLGVGLGLASFAVSAASPALGQIDIPVTNHSFEGPETFFAFPDAEVWEETGPVSSDPRLPGVVDTLDTGVFFNSPVGADGLPSPFFIPNGDGRQIGFIGAQDDVDIAFFQQLDVPYEVGAVYTLTVDVGESFFFPPLTFNPNDPNPPPNPPPALLSLRLYYEDVAMQKITVIDRVVSADELPIEPAPGLLLVEFSAVSASLLTTDLLVGEPIGIDIRPSLGLAGVWNVDNVRLTVDCGPGVAVGDANVDGIIDAMDHAAFAACMTGPGGGPRPAGCPPCAFVRLGDNDGDLDLYDFAELATAFSP